MDTIKTVNVVEYSDNCLQQVVAFPDTDEGNEAAKVCFMSFIDASIVERGHHALDTEEIGDCIMEGIYEPDGGNYQVFLIHSS